MKTVRIIRETTSAEGTFGRLMVDHLDLHTGELPWRCNKPMISCIPTGDYDCIWGMSPKFKRSMYLLKDVEGRSGIRFHSGNYVGDKAMGFKSDVLGCIALGNGFGEISGQNAVLGSRTAMGLFEGHMDCQAFKLVIVEAPTE